MAKVKDKSTISINKRLGEDLKKEMFKECFPQTGPKRWTGTDLKAVSSGDENHTKVQT